VRKGYLKIHFAVDIKTGQVVSMDVTSEKVGDGRRLRRPVGDAEGRVRVGRVLADGAYDSRANFNFPAGEGIEPVIGVGEGAAPCRGAGDLSQEAGRHRAAEVQAEGVVQDPWVRIQMEGRGGLLGDSIKRIFGEYVTAGKFANMAKEMVMKAFIYNIFIAQI
jgi:Transposase DDE domain.